MSLCQYASASVFQLFILNESLVVAEVLIKSEISKMGIL